MYGMEMFYLVLSVCVLQVHSMALKGPVLTRYQPCGLGVIYFDKLTDTLWRGEVNLHLYRLLVDVNIDITFKNQMILYGVSQNSTVVVRDNWRQFIFSPKGYIPDTFNFFISVNGSTISYVPEITNFTLNDVVLCNEQLKSSQTVESLNVSLPHDSTYRHFCGRRSMDHAELTSMRTDAKPGDWPWHVAMLIKIPNSFLAKYQCGGSIISRTAILTAGHCMFESGLLIGTERIVIEAGVTNLRGMNQTGRQTLNAERVILHPGYSHEYATSDLAIVLVNKLRYTEYVQPICIWGPVYDKTALFGKQAVIAGFGTTENNILSDTLRSTNTMIQNDATCIAFSPALYTKLLNEFSICTGLGPDTGINPRNGDSGGGLFIETKQPDHHVSWFLRGVLSKCGMLAGKVLCDPKYYVVYTDVGPHYGWIYHHGGLSYRSNVIS